MTYIDKMRQEVSELEVIIANANELGLNGGGAGYLHKHLEKRLWEEEFNLYSYWCNSASSRQSSHTPVQSIPVLSIV